MYKLIVCDMDGTLLNSSDFISEENKNTIIKLKEMGCNIAIATGRIYTSARIYWKQLGLLTPIIACNGAIIKDLAEDKVLYSSPIPSETGLKIFEMMKNHDVYMSFHAEDRYFSERMEHNVLRYSEYNKTVDEGDRVNITLIDDAYNWYKENLDIPLYKIQANSKDPEVLSKVRTELKKIPNINSTTSWHTNIEIMNGDVSKGNALKVLSEILGVKSEEIICFGDNENDITMFEYAGFGVAMDNSSEFVKQHADYVTLSNNEDGVAHALKKLMKL